LSDKIDKHVNKWSSSEVQAKAPQAVRDKQNGRLIQMETQLAALKSSLRALGVAI
jgi:hypothetical protein